MSVILKSNASQIMKITHNAKIIFKELNVSPYDCNMWQEFSRQTGNWGVGIMKTAIFNDPNSSMLTSKDALELKKFLLANQVLYNKYII